MSKTPISTLVTIAPRGMSFHGHSLRRDLLGSPCRPEQDVCNCAECTPPGQEDRSARLAASAEVGQVECTPEFTDQQLCDWFEAQSETYLNYLYENFGANTPREAWAAHMHGKRTLRCACCDSTNLEQYCHLAPHPIFGCRNCGTELNMDGSVCVEQVDQVEQFQRWLETEARNALSSLEDPPELTGLDLYLHREGCEISLAHCRVATQLLMAFKLEQGA